MPVTPGNVLRAHAVRRPQYEADLMPLADALDLALLGPLTTDKLRVINGAWNKGILLCQRHAADVSPLAMP